MKDPRREIEKFCRRHPDFGIPNLMRYIVIANVVFWLLGAVNRPLMSYLLFSPALILRGQIWRLISFIFIPPSTGLLAFIAFYFYYWIGTTLENQWGTGQFTIYFFTGVILTILYGFGIYFITGKSVLLSSTYIYLSMFFSFAALFPDMQVLFLFIIPVKMKYLALVDAAFFLFSVITTVSVRAISSSLTGRRSHTSHVATSMSSNMAVNMNIRICLRLFVKTVFSCFLNGQMFYISLS